METDVSSVLVTGATGFIGRHLITLLLAQGYRVTAVYKPNDPLLDVLPPDVIARPCDMEDTRQVINLVGAVQPEKIFHLAGLVRGNNLSQLLNVNVLMTENLLQAASQLSSPPRVVLPGSASEVGLLDDPAVSDQAALRPLSVYGVSKAAQTLLGQCYARQGRVPVIIGRIFNITGPGEPASMLCGSMASQIAACEVGEQPPILKVGNLSPTRDYLDVRDVVAALWQLGINGRSGAVHNICSGEERCVEDVVHGLVACASLPITIEPDPDRQRPSDIPRCVGIPDETLHAIGWKPTIPLSQSLSDTVTWWRQAYHSGPTTPL